MASLLSHFGTARQWLAGGDQTLTPKVFVVAMFDKEAINWLAGSSSLNFVRKITLPGLSRGYSDIYCTENCDVCLLIAGMGLINAALSISTLTSSALFDLSKTYFLITGVAGVNPKKGTLGTVAFAKYAVQVDLQLEFDAREIPPTWTTGYVPTGAASLGSYSKIIYGTELFELNDNLRQLAMSFAQKATLTDSDQAAKTRAEYANSPGISIMRRL